VTCAYCTRLHDGTTECSDCGESGTRELETYNGRPSVNVKCHRGPTPAQLAQVEADNDAPGFAEWYDDGGGLDDDGAWNSIAFDDAREDAQNDAEMIFGKGVTVEFEGRSGGHLCVKGLPDLDEPGEDDSSHGEDCAYRFHGSSPCTCHKAGESYYVRD